MVLRNMNTFFIVRAEGRTVHFKVNVEQEQAFPLRTFEVGFTKMVFHNKVTTRHNRANKAQIHHLRNVAKLPYRKIARLCGIPPSVVLRICRKFELRVAEAEGRTGNGK